jgi:hypothetical protein
VIGRSGSFYYFGELWLLLSGGFCKASFYCFWEPLGVFVAFGSVWELSASFHCPWELLRACSSAFGMFWMLLLLLGAPSGSCSEFQLLLEAFGSFYCCWKLLEAFTIFESCLRLYCFKGGLESFFDVSWCQGG